MHSGRIDLNLLTVFDAIYTEGSLTQAARQVGLSQPAMSNALNRLRHLLGDELFVRQGRGIKPTARAHELAPKVHQSLGLVEDALRLPAQFDPARHDEFQIVGFDYSEVVIIPHLHAVLGQRAPQLLLKSISGTSAEHEKALRYGEIALIVDYVRLNEPGSINEPLFSDELVILARADHPSIRGTLDLETMLDLRFVHRADRPDEPEPQIDRVLAGLGLQREIAVSVTNWLALPQIVAGSDLICSCGRRFAETYADHFNLVIHPLPFEVPQVPIYMIWHKNQDERKANRWLRAQVKRACRRMR